MAPTTQLSLFYVYYWLVDDPVQIFTQYFGAEIEVDDLDITIQAVNSYTNFFLLTMSLASIFSITNFLNFAFNFHQPPARLVS